MASEGFGDPIAYTVLVAGTPVLTSDGRQVGTVVRVLADEAADIFDGIVVATGDGERFVDAPEVAELYERAVVLTLGAEDIRRLSEPSAAPAVVDVDRDDLGEESPGARVRRIARRTWDRISGNG
jgi:hypothetical protein